MKNSFSLSLTRKVIGHRGLTKISKLKSSVSIEAENSDRKISDRMIQRQTHLTKQIIKTRYDLDKIQIDLTKLKGDLEC